MDGKRQMPARASIEGQVLWTNSQHRENGMIFINQLKSNLKITQVSSNKENDNLGRKVIVKIFCIIS